MEPKTQRDILKWILGKATRAKRHRMELEERLARIREEIKAPIGSPGYEPLPSAMETGAGAATLILKLAEIEERIQGQKKEIEDAYVMVMDIINLIPVSETARRIFELRHLDDLSFTKAAKEIPISRQGAYKIYNKTLSRLLEFPEIKKMIDGSEVDFCAWYIRTHKLG